MCLNSHAGVPFTRGGPVPRVLRRRVALPRGGHPGGDCRAFGAHRRSQSVPRLRRSHSDGFDQVPAGCQSHCGRVGTEGPRGPQGRGGIPGGRTRDLGAHVRVGAGQRILDTVHPPGWKSRMQQCPSAWLERARSCSYGLGASRPQRGAGMLRAIRPPAAVGAIGSTGRAESSFRPSHISSSRGVP